MFPLTRMGKIGPDLLLGGVAAAWGSVLLLTWWAASLDGEVRNVLGRALRAVTVPIEWTYAVPLVIGAAGYSMVRLRGSAQRNGGRIEQYSLGATLALFATFLLVRHIGVVEHPDRFDVVQGGLGQLGQLYRGADPVSLVLLNRDTCGRREGCPENLWSTWSILISQGLGTGAFTGMGLGIVAIAVGWRWSLNRQGIEARIQLSPPYAATDAQGIFLCFSSHDRQAVAAQAKKLKAAGLDVFWDEDIRLGTDFEGRLREALSHTRVLLCWATPHWETPWTTWELGFAQGRGLLVVPIRPGSSELPERLRGIQGILLPASDSDLGAALLKHGIGKVEPIPTDCPIQADAEDQRRRPGQFG